MLMLLLLAFDNIYCNFFFLKLLRENFCLLMFLHKIILYVASGTAISCCKRVTDCRMESVRLVKRCVISLVLYIFLLADNAEKRNREIL